MQPVVAKRWNSLMPVTDEWIENVVPAPVEWYCGTKRGYTGVMCEKMDAP